MVSWSKTKGKYVETGLVADIKKRKAKLVMEHFFNERERERTRIRWRLKTNEQNWLPMSFT